MDWLRICPIVLLLTVILPVIFCWRDDEDEVYDPYTTTDPKKREPHPCEVCKFFITELHDRLEISGRSKEVLEIGHGIEKKKRQKYSTSELRLIEALVDPHICDQIVKYNVHAERDGSNRYAKGQSQTMSTLHGLKDKGVKVELGIPYDLWDVPSAEVTKMQKACFALAENYEEDIEEWYYHNQHIPLKEYICRDRYLKESDQTCLDEKFVPKEDEDEQGRKKKKKKKKSKKNKKGDNGPTGEEKTEKPKDEL